MRTNGSYINVYIYTYMLCRYWGKGGYLSIHKLSALVKSSFVCLFVGGPLQSDHAWLLSLAKREVGALLYLDRATDSLYAGAHCVQSIQAQAHDI